MKTGFFALAALCAALMCFPSRSTNAEEAVAQFFTKPVDKAFEAGNKAGKGVLVVSGCTIPMGQAAKPDQWFESAYSQRPALRSDIVIFERAYVNCFSVAASRTDFIIPALSARYGRPIALCIFAPGGFKPLWSKQLADQKPGMAPLAADDIASAVKEAREAYNAWKKGLDDVVAKYEAKDVEDKNLRQNVDAQEELAAAYAKGCAVEPALAALTEAIAIVKKDKEAANRDERMEALTFRRGEVAAECGDHARAALEYAEFIKKFKKSGKANEARLLHATALVDAGDDKAARDAIGRILADKAAADIHDKARELQARVK